MSLSILHIKKLAVLPVLAAAMAGCMNLKDVNPYKESLAEIIVLPEYPESFPEDEKSGIELKFTDRNRNYNYTFLTDADGTGRAELPLGSYRLVMNHRSGANVFNAAVDRIILNGETAGGSGLVISFPVQASQGGDIVFKEIYSGGCTKYPEQGNYASDSYVILHNNSSEVQYLDGLCFGTLDPYRSGATNVWVDTDPETGESVFQDFIPIIQAIWQFGGDGTDFPLESGEDAVLAVFGAIDHAAKYPQSVNLNNADYFVCYNTTYFPNPLYHPAPGNNIRQDHILDVLIKVGVANAYTFAQASPAPVIFRPMDGRDMTDFLGDASNIIQKPGSKVDKIVKIPPEWVLDGVEVFEKGAANKKRIMPGIDAGAVEFSGPYYGHTLFRKTDEAASARRGYEVLCDTNNSSEDFYERGQQSLHE